MSIWYNDFTCKMVVPKTDLNLGTQNFDVFEAPKTDLNLGTQNFDVLVIPKKDLNLGAG